jgi:inactive STAND/Effector-associated domain 9
MIANAKSLRKKMLQDRLKCLEDDINTVNEKISQTIDEVQCNQLKRHFESLFKDYEDVETQIKQLAPSDISYGTRYNNWEEHLCKINFSHANNILKWTSEKVFTEQGGAVFFLLQNYSSMGGKWCVEKIKSALADQGSWSPKTVGFTSRDIVTEEEFLRRLGSCFGIKEQSTTAIINKIYNSLHTGSTVFIEINIFSINTATNFLEWIINNFWIPLINKLPEISAKKPFIKFVMILTVEDANIRDCLPPSVISKNTEFNSRKLFEVELSNWTQGEIWKWLCSFSGLANSGIQGEDIKRMTENVYKITQGRPLDVYHQLMHELDQAFR